jgi:putative salt-induced outer membrane protein
MKLLFVLFASVFVLQADELMMKNGDKLSGKILQFDGKVITIKSDYAGVVTITWDAVASVTSTQPLSVAVQGGQVVVGPVTTADDKLTVQTATAGPVTEPRAAVTTIRNLDEQAAYEAHEALYRHPRLVDLWVGNASLGYAKATGSTKTSNLNISATATRATDRDSTTVFFTSLYATDGSSGKKVTTANANRGGFLYQFNLTPRFYVYAGSGFESDQFQQLDLRFTPGGGVGYHVIKNEATLFDVFAGGNYNKEYYYNNVNRSSAEIQVGEDLLHKFSKATSVHERLTFFPNVTDGGQYRMNFDLSFDTKLRKWLAWQIAVSDRYISNPVPGTTTNNLIITTGINLTLAK